MEIKDTRQVPDSVWTSSYVSASLAVILVAEILGISAYAYYRVTHALDPQNLADRIELAIRENYPEVRKELVEQVKLKSPEIAEQVSQELMASAPEARQELEEFTARQLDVGIEKITEISAEQFRKLLQQNREEIIAAFDKVEAAPEEAERIVLETEKSIEEQLGVDIQNQARSVLTVHRELNDKLQRLTDSSASLRSRELLERRIVRILRTMQEQGETAAIPVRNEQEDVVAQSNRKLE
jgi:hypothetical protein